ncbi:MAG: response regulator [Anaerolineae bacterium]|nr:response regulator [Anaerolineae bacterium]
MALALVVDDDREFQKLMGHILAGVCDVQGAGTVDEARHLMRRTHVDVILLDIRLPGALGWDLLAEMRNRRDSPPVIVITADARASVSAQADDMGAVYTFFKPIVPSKVRKLVKAAIE